MSERKLSQEERISELQKALKEGGYELFELGFQPEYEFDILQEKTGFIVGEYDRKTERIRLTYQYHDEPSKKLLEHLTRQLDFRDFLRARNLPPIQVGLDQTRAAITSEYRAYEDLVKRLSSD